MDVLTSSRPLLVVAAVSAVADFAVLLPGQPIPRGQVVISPRTT